MLIIPGTLLKLIILSWFIIVEKYNISENVMLKYSKCVVNICCCAPRRMNTHNAHPCFEWYIPSKSPILRELLNMKSGNINGGFSCIFGRLKVRMNLQDNGVWRVVHHKLIYKNEQGSWMGLNAWTFFIPLGCALGHKQSFMHSIPFISP